MTKNTTRRLAILLIGLFYAVMPDRLISQSVLNLMPPSPEASAIVSYGNSGVNFYTGQPSMSIPIYTAMSKGFQLPVSLNYSGFGGINVEATAPWVGLGWALNAGGVVTRTLKGKGDEESNGYLVLPAIPNYDPTNPSIQTAYYNYFTGSYDPQPDEFRYNINGMSGAFYFTKSGGVMQVPDNNVKIVPTISANVLTGFTLTDTNGIQYECTTIEQNKTVPGGGSPGAAPYKNSAWYVTNIKDAYGTVLMTFEYYSYTDQKTTIRYPMSNLETSATFTESNLAYSDNYTNAKRIKKINFDQGYIEFDESSYDRLDLINDRYLDKIEIYDKTNVLIKKFQFTYTYFDSQSGTGVSPMASTSSVNYYGGYYTKDHYKRLKLDQIQEYDNTGITALPAYEFTYDLTQKLPSRFSFSRDHWGFYNGASNGVLPEPNHKVVYYNELLATTGPYFKEFGTANRSASVNYTKAGVLSSIKYPTGGTTTFEMELNTVEDTRLSGTYSNQTTFITPNATWQNFTISLATDPFETVNFNGLFGSVNGIKVEVRRTSDNVVIFSKDFFGLGASVAGTIDLGPNSYQAKITKLNGVAYSAPDNVTFSWQNETNYNNKPAGGLRVKTITDYDGINTSNNVVRKFYYNEDGAPGSSNSTGRLAIVPQYGYNKIFTNEVSPGVYVPRANGYIRSIKSTYPLMFTNGGAVGYKKVTVLQESGSDKLKSEYHYTTTEDIRPYADGYFFTPRSYEGQYYVAFTGKTEETYPFAEINERDDMRGLLIKQIDYAYISSTYKVVREIENKYGLNKDMPVNGGIMPYPTLSTPSAYESVEGIVFDGTENRFKRHRMYTGRVDKYQTIEKIYDYNSASFVQIQTDTYYDMANSGYYAPSRIDITDSEGNLQKTEYKYAYDNFTEVSSTVRTNLLNKYRIGHVLKQEQYEGTTKLATTVNNYGTFGSAYYPNEVKTSVGTGTLETRVRYHSYDSYGNPYEVSQEGGPRTVYLWGYNSSVPVAKVENATLADVLAVVNQTILDNPSTDVALNTELNKLRTATSLKYALVTTMTYKRGIGVSTITKPNGLISYYEYDGFGRLKYIKDKDGNILKKSEYAYQVNANTTTY